MIPYQHLGVTTCQVCARRLEFDRRTAKRPRVCPACKRQREKTRQQRVKTQCAATDCVALERLAIRTHAEVGALMGISAEMVRKVELGALEKLRRRFGALKRELLD